MTAYQGVRILDCSQGLVGPMAAMLLGDFGAEVLKVEPPQGDRAAATPGYQMWNRNKRRLALDLDISEHRARLEALVGGADVAIFDAAPSRMKALGLDTLAERYPRLVSLWVPAYSTHGLWSELPAHHGALMALTGGAFRQASYAEQPVYLVAPILHYTQAVMAANGVGAALLERGRSGRGQTVTVSGLQAVAFAGGAGAAAQMIGRQPLGASPSYRLYRCGDGQYLFLATLFGYFFQRALKALDVEDAAATGDPDVVIGALEARFAEEPRDHWLAILKAADVPAGRVGRREDWLASDIIARSDMRAVVDHPALGPVEMPGVAARLGSTPGKVRHAVRDAEAGEVSAFAAPRPAPVAVNAVRQAPLAGIRVLDLGTVIAGAYASAILANLGAEVIKVEPAEGDPWRGFPIGFAAYNRGKRGVVMDLKQAAGRDLFLDMARQADVVLDNYRLGVRARFGLDYAALRAVNRRIVSCSITTYGAGAEESRQPGFDPLLQARGGLMAAQGGDDEEPVFHAIAINDYATATMAAFGVIAALNAREATGEGQEVETSLAAQSALFQSGELTTWPGARPAAKGCRDCLGIAALDRFYACADGWILIACRTPGEAAAAVRALGIADWMDRPDLLDEPRDGALAERVADALATRSVREVLTGLLRAGCAAFPVRCGEEITADPWLWESRFFESPVHTPAGVVPDRTYADFSATPAGFSRPHPELGEHSWEVLADFGVEPEQIERLMAEGVVSG